MLLGADSLAIRCDLTRPEDIASLFGQVRAVWGPPLVLVNNAGTAPSAKIQDTDDAVWAQTLELNLTAPFRCCREAVPGVAIRTEGRTPPTVRSIR